MAKQLAASTVSAIDVMADAWAAAEARAGLTADKDVPECAETQVQYARRTGIPLSTAQVRLDRMVACGVVKTGKAYRANVRGHVVLAAVYWPAGLK
jgi:hypothetical protein